MVKVCNITKTVGWLLAVCWPTVGWRSTNCWLSVGRLSVDGRPNVSRRLTNSRPTDSKQLADCWPTVGRQTAPARDHKTLGRRQPCVCRYVWVSCSALQGTVQSFWRKTPYSTRSFIIWRDHTTRSTGSRLQTHHNRQDCHFCYKSYLDSDFSDYLGGWCP